MQSLPVSGCELLLVITTEWGSRHSLGGLRTAQGKSDNKIPFPERKFGGTRAHRVDIHPPRMQPDKAILKYPYLHRTILFQLLKPTWRKQKQSAGYMGIMLQWTNIHQCGHLMLLLCKQIATTSPTLRYQYISFVEVCHSAWHSSLCFDHTLSSLSLSYIHYYLHLDSIFGSSKFIPYLLVLFRTYCYALSDLHIASTSISAKQYSPISLPIVASPLWLLPYR